MEDTPLLCSAEYKHANPAFSANILSCILVIKAVQDLFAPAEFQEGFDPSDVCTLPRSTGAQGLLSQQYSGPCRSFHSVHMALHLSSKLSSYMQCGFRRK